MKSSFSTVVVVCAGSIGIFTYILIQQEKMTNEYLNVQIAGQQNQIDYLQRTIDNLSDEINLLIEEKNGAVEIANQKTESVFPRVGVDSIEKTKALMENDEAMQKFAQCLTQNGMIMYGTERCNHCAHQKALFGKARNEITYVDCDKSRNVCLVAGVRGFPTWKDVYEQTYPGTQTIERLSEISQCLF